MDNVMNTIWQTPNEGGDTRTASATPPEVKATNNQVKAAPLARNSIDMISNLSPNVSIDDSVMSNAKNSKRILVLLPLAHAPHRLSFQACQIRLHHLHIL